MGETSDAVKETLGEVVGEQYQKAKEVAGNVAERAKSVAQEEGLTRAVWPTLPAMSGTRSSGWSPKQPAAAGSQLDDKFKPEKQGLRPKTRRPMRSNR